MPEINEKTHEYKDIFTKEYFEFILEKLGSEWKNFLLIEKTDGTYGFKLLRDDFPTMDFTPLEMEILSLFETYDPFEFNNNYDNIVKFETSNVQ